MKLPDLFDDVRYDGPLCEPLGLRYVMVEHGEIHLVVHGPEDSEGWLRYLLTSFRNSVFHNIHQLLVWHILDQEPWPGAFIAHSHSLAIRGIHPGLRERTGVRAGRHLVAVMHQLHERVCQLCVVRSYSARRLVRSPEPVLYAVQVEAVPPRFKCPEADVQTSFIFSPLPVHQVNVEPVQIGSLRRPEVRR